jgi:KipI family sensor histidine kinase inhibitor
VASGTNANDSGVFVCGDDLVAVRLDGTRECQALADELRATGQWLECVAGISSCVARFENTSIGIDVAVRRFVDLVDKASVSEDTERELVEIPVCYGGTCGPDLGDLCEQLGLTPEEFVDMHSGREYRVDMLGFTPGFAFIGGLDDALNVPRRREPRVRVEAGSVGIAGGRTGIYTLAGPGGWPLVGRTPEVLFDAHAEEPFRLRAGTRVRFVPISHEEFAAKTAT